MSKQNALLLPRPGLTVIGIDEAGRGCWAGPVVAGAVAWGRPITGLNDSKKLTAVQRENLVPLIEQEALAWGIGSASAAEIDELNILQATFLAMERAVEAVINALESKHAQAGGEMWVDGNRLPPWRRNGWVGQTYIGGDGTHAPIAAASILAKEHRDALMLALHERYPVYGFAKHKSYGTAEHQTALKLYGPCPEHRHSFRPLKNLKGIA